MTASVRQTKSVFENRVFTSGLLAGAAAFEHQVDHGVARIREVFVVRAHPTVAIEPGEGPLHDPPMRENLEPRCLRGPTDDLQAPRNDEFTHCPA